MLARPKPVAKATNLEASPSGGQLTIVGTMRGGSMPQDGTAMRSPVSVVMPAKDRAHLIERSLRSIHGQTLPPLEVLVVDDGSTDDTADVARRCGANVIELQVNEGIGSARNHAIRAAVGEWVAFCDSDDEWEVDHLENLLTQRGGNVLVTAPAHATSGRVLGNPTGRSMPLTTRSVLTPATWSRHQAPWC